MIGRAIKSGYVLRYSAWEKV
ncbi:hypothetical protein AGR7B_Lc10003 [Agrobacterium deltaense RV3]|nr:hypothetical protein AGR7B_Lc10003 [Agrobacterium deltaense RV3]